MNLNKIDSPRLIPHADNGWQFHPTCLESYLACPREYYFQALLGLTSKTSIINFHFGSAYHAGVGLFHTVRGMYNLEAIKMFDPEGEYSDELKEDNFLLAKTMAVKAFIDYWNSKKVRVNDKKNGDTGLIVVGKYCDRYSRDQAEYDVSMIEAPLKVSMPNNTLLVLTIDRIHKTKNDYITVVDNKTSGMSLSDWFWKGYENSFQLGMYDYAICQILGHCEATQVDAAAVPWKNAASFCRRTNSFTDMQRESFLHTYVKATNSICSSLAKYGMGSAELLEEFPCCQTSCSSYGGCGFLPICKYGFDHPSVKTLFEIESKRIKE